MALRGVLERLYSREAAKAITGFVGKTPRDPYELSILGVFLVNRLRKVDLSALPDPALPRTAVSLDLESLAWRVWDLHQVLRALQNWSRDQDALLEARNRAQKDFDQMYTAAAATLQGLYKAAGLPEYVPGIRNPGYSVAEAMKRKLASPMPTLVIPRSGWTPPESALHPV